MSAKCLAPQMPKYSWKTGRSHLSDQSVDVSVIVKWILDT